MEKQENGNYKNLNGEAERLCKAYDGHQEKESFHRCGSHPCITPSISPTLSLASSDSCISSSSDISIDANSLARCYQEEVSSDSSQEDLNFCSNGFLQNSGSSFNVNGICRCKTEEINNMETYCIHGTVGEREILEIGYGQQSKGNGVENDVLSISNETETSHSWCDDMNTQFWLPPEPEETGDDILGSLSNYDDDLDDDDECGDGMKWGKPSCLSSNREEGYSSSKFKEEKQRAMNDVLNGKFKMLVADLLKYVGVSLSLEDGDNWVDIVTFLSWEAASFVRNDGTESKGMDPDGYIKIKCVATGTRNQSQVVKGLVFKKHAALKRMPTKYDRPRLLLIKGELGPSSSGLSSFELLQQEEDSLKPVLEMIEMFHPNVVLVEKTVSRDIQQSLLAKGMTVVSDMKSHRLERIARCTGSQIISSDQLNGQKLGKCDSFRIEKFEEEHAALAEGGKKPRKSLMFLEGCPTRMGCTVLLMGAHTDELKRIKCVVQCAVVMAYHLILETSFILDQRAMFSILPHGGVTHMSIANEETSFVTPNVLNESLDKNSPVKIKSSSAINTPMSNGLHEEGLISPDLALPEGTPLSHEPYNPIVFSRIPSISASLKKVIGDSFPLFSSTSRQSMSTYFGFDEIDNNDNIQTADQVSSFLEAINPSDEEVKRSSDQDKTCVQPLSLSIPCKDDVDVKKSVGSNKERAQSKDGISTVLSSSILVLVSSRNALRGTICEHCHFSRIKFYQNFDVPLGKFLQDNLLNQSPMCKTCGEAPEAHIYYYAHHNKQLTIQVKNLPTDKHLPFGSEGKLWMWSRCGKCRPYEENFKPTKRVLISAAARGLSFGKFLELSFYDQSSFSKRSVCGHSFNKDFLYFFGLGPMVAIFRYSPVTTYSVCLPPQKIANSNSTTGEFFENELKNVHLKGVVLFEDISKVLKNIGSQFSGLTLNIQGSIMEFADIENMLLQEREKFEDEVKIIKYGKTDNTALKFLSLNKLQLVLVLESCVWDRRLHFLLSSDIPVFDKMNSDETKLELACPKMDVTSGEDSNVKEITVIGGDEDSSSHVDMNNMLETSVEADDSTVKEIPVEEGSSKLSGDGHKPFPIPEVGEDVIVSTQGMHSDEASAEEILVKPEFYGQTHDENIFNVPPRGRSPFYFSLSNLDNCKEWIWIPFYEIQLEYMKGLEKGYSPKFEYICQYTSNTMVRKLITDEGSRLYIPVGAADYIVSDFDDEFSSMIACALSLLKDLPVGMESVDEVLKRERSVDSKKFESLNSFSRLASLSTPRWSSYGSQDSDGVHLLHSISAEELRLSSFDGLNLLDSLVSSGAAHREVSLGPGTSNGKGKYSVVCLYADLFRNLRNRCFSSELDYIASLSRCRNWNAKGGKSKSFFAKTLDDRFIIKEIKRTESDSFMKFAPEYFQYMNQCFELGNQTCLAKIFGIYQIRFTKSGKELKHDLMVMENLSFGRDITRQYDLKGALHARFNSSADGPGDVLLDQNFVNDMNASPLYFSRQAMRNLQRAVWNDTTFLTSINVMDYSLLVGVDTQQHVLVCGIIDYLRQYTWDKQLENWVKSSLVVPKNQLPTIISPIEYKKRFRKFIHNHFLSVPDSWCYERCEFCGLVEDSDSLIERPQEHEEQNGDSSHINPQRWEG